MPEIFKSKSSHNSFTGFLAQPPTGSAPLVVVFPAWWGLNDFFRQFCTRLANQGFLAYGVDYYHGKVATSIEEAKSLRSGLDRDLVKADLKSTIASQNSQGLMGGKSFGAIGFSLGASLAADLARTYQEVTAVVLFYGIPGGKFEQVKAAFQGHFAEHDEWGATPERIIALQARLASASREHCLYTYPGTQHWFFESDRPVEYNPSASETAWQRMVELLKSKLA